MKKFSILAMMLLAVVAMNFTACTPTETTIPTITVEAATTNDYAPGNVVSYAVAVATTNKELKTFTVAVAGGDAVTDATVNAPAGTFSDATASEFASDLTTVAFTYTFTVGEVAAATEIALTFTVTDDEETNDAVKTFTVGAAAPSYVEYTSVQSDGDYGTGSVNGFDFSTGKAVSYNSGEDLVLIYNGTYGNSVVSPDATWLSTLYSYTIGTYTNSTNSKVEKLSGVDYANVDDAYLDGLTVASDAAYSGSGNAVAGVVAGDVIAFETGGVKGVLKIESVTASKGVAPITYSIKVQTAGAGK